MDKPEWPDCDCCSNVANHCVYDSERLTDRDTGKVHVKGTGVRYGCDDHPVYAEIIEMHCTPSMCCIVIDDDEEEDEEDDELFEDESEER